VEEREQTVMLAVDISGSARLGSGTRTVRQAAAELAAILAFSAVGSGDRAGLLLFSDRVELELPPRDGTRQAFRITREALYRESGSPRTSVALACEHLARVLKRRAHVFLLSDFLAADFERPLGMLARRHDVVALRLLDARHLGLPDAGLLPWTDPETGRTLLVDSGSARVRERMAQLAVERRDTLRAAIARHGVDLVDIPVDGAVVEPLVAYLRQRERHLR
jgi:uncharacterized protein (DUF58 family)